MDIRQRIKRAFLKKNYDFDRPDMDLHNFHPQLRVFMIPMGVFFNNRNSLTRFIWPAVCGGLTVVAVTLELIFVHHGLQVKDYSFATECFCYFVMLGFMPLVIGSVLVNRDCIYVLLDSMNKDFLYISKLEPRYKDFFLRAQALIWKLFISWWIFCVSVGILFISMTILQLIYFSLIGTTDEHFIRPLIFPMWLPEDDPYRTPNYEIFLFIQVMVVGIYIQNFSIYVNFQFHVLLHNINLLGLIILDIEVLFDGLDESVTKLPRQDPRRIAVQNLLNSRMARIVTWHKSVVKSIVTLSSLQGPPLVYQVSCSSIALCLMLYQVADKLDEGKYDIMFIILSFAACLQLGIPCLLGTVLMEKAFEVCDACWNCSWYETSLGCLLRTDLLILMLRTQQPLSIKLTGLPQLSLETFSSVITTAYSYFNMLRQYN